MGGVVVFFLRKLITTVVSLFVIITVSFFLVYATPGDPFSSDGRLSEESLVNIKKKYGLDRPLYKQYFSYLRGLASLNFGLSFRYLNVKVSQVIGETLPVSLALGVSALSLAVGLGSMLGILSAVKKNHWSDYLSSSFAIAGISLPLFVVAPIMIFIFAIKLNLVPTSGWISEDYNFKRVFLPVFSLSLPYIAMIARLMRVSMINVLKSDYIKTARAMGASLNKIIIKHALKAAFLPILSYIGPLLVNLVTGSIIVEQIFRIPGMGYPFINSALSRDYPLILGCVITYSFILILMNMIVDFFYTLLDPRISL